MSISVASILLRAGDLLTDAAFTRWTQVELLRWINDGQREVALHKPGASAVNGAVTLVAGTKQSIPVAGISLIDIVRNMGADGLVAGKAIRPIEREDMDAINADWHSANTSTTVKHFMFDERNPRNFYVYPPIPASPSVQVEMIYAKSPTDCTLAGNLSLDDIYANVLLDYALYRAYSKDAEVPASAQKAQAYYALVSAALGIKSQADIANSPNVTHTGGR